MLDINVLYENPAVHQLWPMLILVLAMGMILFAWFSLDRRTGYILIGTIIGFCLPAAAINAFNMFTDPEMMFMQGGLLFGMVAFDNIYLFLIMLFSIYLLGVLSFSRDIFGDEEKWNWPAYLCACIVSLIGIILLASTRHMILFVIAMELSFLSHCILLLFEKGNVAESSRGVRRYAVWGLIGSAITIYGVSLLYRGTGCLDFQQIALRLSLGGVSPMEVIALSCFAIGLCFQMGVLPFQNCYVSLFRSGGADLNIWLGVAPIAAGLIAMARLFHLLAWFTSDDFNRYAVIVLCVIGGVTMCWANIAALREKKVKKILAWGTAAQVGGLLMGVAIWQDNSGLAAVMAYLIVLALMNFVVFGAAGIVEWRTGKDELTEYAGLWGRSPLLAMMMTLSLCSLMGLPPLAGFTVKWNLLFVLWQKGLTFPAVIMMLNIFVSLIYYLRIVRVLAVPSANREKITTPVLPAVFMWMGLIGFTGLFFVRYSFFRFINTILYGIFG